MSLEGRLLYASALAYRGRADGPLPGSPDGRPPAPADAGFAAPPAVFTNHNGVDSVLVGPTDQGVVVAFRGTMRPDADNVRTLVDWHQDFHAMPVADLSYPGAVHDGFRDAVHGLWDRLKAEVERLLELPQYKAAPDAVGSPPLLLTGHSKGGAMAALAAWRFQSGGTRCRVITFAAPKPGNRVFAAAYNQLVDHTRYEYADDIVPHLPLSVTGLVSTLESLPHIGHVFSALERYDYDCAGTLRFIDWSGEVLPDTPELAIERRLNLSRLIVRMRYAQIAGDHSLLAAGGYARLARAAAGFPYRRGTP